MNNENQVKRPIEFAAVLWTAMAVVFLGLAHGAFALATFKDLPAQIPVHFNFEGAPDRFEEAGFLSWFLPWLISVGVAATMVSISLWIDRIPYEYLNIPKKEEFLKLPAAARSRVLAVTSFHLLVLTGLIMAFLFSTHICTALFISGSLSRLPAMILVAGIIFPLLGTIVLLVRITVAVNRETERMVASKRGQKPDRK